MPEDVRYNKLKAESQYDLKRFALLYDYIRYHPEKVAKMMPKSVLQSNWYKHTDFNDLKNKSVKAYIDLEALGYDQVPGGSNYYENTEKCFFNNVKFCSENVADSRLLGFIQFPWKQVRVVWHLFPRVEVKAKQWFSELSLFFLVSQKFDFLKLHNYGVWPLPVVIYSLRPHY